MFVVATPNLSFHYIHFEWPEIWHAVISWPLPNWLDFVHHLLIFLILTLFCLSETDQIRNCRTFSGERQGAMAWTLACWCILTAFQSYYILVMVCWFSSFSHRFFGIVIQVKFGVSGDFLQNALEEWLEIWHSDVSCLHFQLLTFWSWSVDIPHFNLVKQVKFEVFGHFLENALMELAELICHIRRNGKDNFQHTKIIRSPSGGYPWLLCSQTFLVWYCLPLN